MPLKILKLHSIVYSILKNRYIKSLFNVLHYITELLVVCQSQEDYITAGKIS